MRKTLFSTASVATIVLSLGIMLSSQPVSAATMAADCATQWKTMDAAKTVPAGMTEKAFLAQCAAEEAKMKKPAAKATPVVAKKKAKGKKPAMATDVKPVDATKPAEDATQAPPADAVAAPAEKPVMKKKKPKKPVAGMAKPVDAAKPLVATDPATPPADATATPPAADVAKTTAMKPAMKKKKKPAMALAPAKPVEATPQADAAATPPADNATVPATKPVAMKMKKVKKPEATTTMKPEAQTMAPDKKPADKAMKKAATPVDPIQQARVTECSNQWKALKVANKVPAGQTWPKFWTECVAKMKAAGK